MHLQCAGGSYEHGELGGEACLAALDVVELLGSEVSAEACFGDDVIGTGHGQFGRQHRVASMGDIGKGTSMHEGGCVLSRLY